MTKSARKLIVLTLSVIVLIAGIVLYFNQKKIKTISPQEAGNKAVSYINQNLLQKGTTASLISTTEENGIYKIHLKVGGKEFNSYVTKDGKLLFPEAINLEKFVNQKEENQPSQEIPKRDTPDVKLFVMSYCPYGLQAEKMYLPVYNLLKDKLQMEIYFVNYAMHEKKEIDENLRQYCIQKEQREKYSDYLSCFVKDGNYDKCLSSAKINKKELSHCLSETDKKYNITSQYNDKNTWLSGRFPRFDIHSDLNEKYKVQGSPTIIINDQLVNINPRSPEKFKETICQAFNSQPKECSQTLSTETPSPGFGTGKSSSSSGGCGK